MVKGKTFLKRICPEETLNEETKQEVSVGFDKMRTLLRSRESGMTFSQGPKLASCQSVINASSEKTAWTQLVFRKSKMKTYTKSVHVIFIAMGEGEDESVDMNVGISY
ncbi:hypothetical protein OPV43_022 [Saccharomyces cerevisiae synthetic construct]|uniref:Putative uncharacterized protein YCL046W n=2 Tax=Saccharomyces cerevisiae TaxID=4932 RepID=YCE6_YEAST|nr:RecName: Full=Putative uncharacterized protein YCL046W [Saccharomyces cerevisiae S288C]AAT93335.1 YCL046W [Saccharomyces cerevisiae]AHV79221.1 hypothetical protein [synthetic construct]UZT75777.1 hypothetical protein OPV43_022 [Saccharomyces cerevisiae synthetic construct]CAY78161.1 EC1118_1C17_0243p [Saccharomyces cerevisiae EC1118]KZV12808.1 hypothetical protein WN66_00615 [Saccharomyces cerevisiae]